jgi:site-specific recombinase XerD
MGVSQTLNTSAMDDLSLLLEDWSTHLRARNVAPSTIASYAKVGRSLLAYLRETGMPTGVTAVRREHLEAFLADLAERPTHRGAPMSAATVARHYRSLQQLFRWLVEDGELADSPMARMRPVRVPEQPVPVLREDDLRRLLAACAGNSFENRRDAALIRFLLDTGVRSSELIGITLEDFEAARGTSSVTVMGKGRKARSVPYGVKTADALRRYLRARQVHPAAKHPALWLGKKGPLTTSGLAQLLERRGKDAGLVGLHPHLFRHYFAHAYLSSGGQQVDLQRLAGWDSEQMVARYAKSAGVERAHANYRERSPGDRL